MNLMNTPSPKNFQKKRNWERRHSTDLVMDMKLLLDDLVDDLFEQMEEINDEKITEYVIVKHNGQTSKASRVIDTDRRFVTDFYKKLKKGFIVPIQKNNFCQLKVHQQFIWNFCGYHMLYNTFQIVKFFRTGKSLYLKQLLSRPNESNVRFWQFKHDMTNTLRKWARKHKKSKDQLWNDKWCLNGDLERSHLVVLLTESNLIRTAFMTNPAMYSRVRRMAEKLEYQNQFGIYHELISIFIKNHFLLDYLLEICDISILRVVVFSL